MKIQQIQNGHNPEPQITETQPAEPQVKVEDRFYIDENEDGSVTFPLTDGTLITMRDLLTEDITKVEQFSMRYEGGAGSTAIALKLIALLCIKWGDKTSVSYDELTKKPLRKFMPDLKRFNKVFEFFRLDDLFAQNE